MARGGNPMHGMPHMGGHPNHFQNHNHQNQQQAGGWRFSWMNIIPIYTLCIVGYAIYIYFKVKNKTPEEREKRRGGIPKSELGELKERLAKTEAALTKLMDATSMISQKMKAEDLQKLFGDQKIIEELLKKEEKRHSDSEAPDHPATNEQTEKNQSEKSTNDQEKPEQTDENKENSDKKSDELSEINLETDQTADGIEEIILKKSDESSEVPDTIRKRTGCLVEEASAENDVTNDNEDVTDDDVKVTTNDDVIKRAVETPNLNEPVSNKKTE